MSPKQVILAKVMLNLGSFLYVSVTCHSEGAGSEKSHVQQKMKPIMKLAVNPDVEK